MVGLGLSALAAAMLLLAASAFEDGLLENSDPASKPGEWIMAASAMAAVGACAALVGVAIRSVRAVRLGSVAQLAGGIWLAWLFASLDFQAGLAVLAPFLALTLLLIAASRWLCRPRVQHAAES
jgi:hypothetical protein